MDVANWIAMPLAGERLESVVFFGNGKDAELGLTFADGRRVTLPTSAVRVEVDGGIVVDLSSWDDISMRIDYRGPDLHLHSGRFGFPDGEEDADFLEAAQSWLAEGCEEDLGWVVEVEMRLVSRPPDSSDAA